MSTLQTTLKEIDTRAEGGSGREPLADAHEHYIPPAEAAVEPPLPELPDAATLPPIGSWVRYYCRPGEGRAAKLLFPALVMHQETTVRDGQHLPDGGLALMVFFAADDICDRPRVSMRSDANPYPAWQQVPGGMPPPYVDSSREVMGLAQCIFGDYEPPPKPVMEHLADFEQRLRLVEVAASAKPSGKKRGPKPRK